MKGMFDPKKTAIQELLAHLGKHDDEELGEMVKPKDAALEVTKVEADGEPVGAELEVEGKPELSDEEISELIEALQSKLA